MNRRRFLGGAGLALCYPRLLSAQTPARVYRLGMIVADVNPRSAPFIAAFERRLRELGWIDGSNIIIDFATGESRDQLERAAARFTASRVDAILAAWPELGAEVVSASTQTIPIVIVALNYDPVQKGYAKSLAQPGRNITGISFRNPEVGPKQIELLHAAMPAASRVGVLWTKYSADQVSPVEAASARLGLRPAAPGVPAEFPRQSAFRSRCRSPRWVNTLGFTPPVAMVLTRMFHASSSLPSIRGAFTLPPVAARHG